MEKKNSNTLLVLFVLATLLLGCKKNEPLMESADLENGVVIYEGEFQKRAHQTKGSAFIESNGQQTILAIEGFETDNGPDLFVYLSTDENASQSINLGELKSTSGAFYYEINQEVDYENYKHVLIWCKRYSALFGAAELEMN